MKLHGNAALSLNQRRRMVCRVVEQGWSITKAAAAAEVSDRTSSKWVARYRSDGEAGLLDRSSAPGLIPHRTPEDRVEVIVALRRLRMTGAEIAFCLGMALSTVSAVLLRVGLGKLSRLEPPEPPNRYERRHAGELLHIDVKKLGRIRGAGHRVTGSRASQKKTRRNGKRVGVAGWEVRARLRRRRDAPGLRRSPARREGDHRGRFPAPGDRVLHQPRHRREGRDVRQRRLLPLHDPRPRLPHNGRAAPAHTPLPAAHQRQSGALQPHPARRLGLRRPIYGTSTERTRALDGWLWTYNHRRPHGALSHQTPIARLNELNNLAGFYI